MTVDWLSVLQRYHRSRSQKILIHIFVTIKVVNEKCSKVVVNYTGGSESSKCNGSSESLLFTVLFPQFIIFP